MKDRFREIVLSSAAGALQQEYISVPPEARSVHYCVSQYGADDDIALCRLVKLHSSNFSTPGRVTIEGLDVFSWILRTSETGNATMEGSCRLQPGTKQLRWDLQATGDGSAVLQLHFSEKEDTPFLGGKTYYTSRSGGSAEANIFHPVPQNAKTFDITLCNPVGGVVPVQHAVEDLWVYPRAGLISTSSYSVGVLATNVSPQTVTQNRYTGRVTPHYLKVRMTANATSSTEFVQQFNFWVV